MFSFFESRVNKRKAEKLKNVSGYRDYQKTGFCE